MTSLCENCCTEHNGNYGSGRFCSKLCARSFSTKGKRSEINKKVSDKLKQPLKSKICICCGASFVAITRSKICSALCKSKLKSEASKKGRANSKLRGTFTGWKTRTKEPSYPEQYFIDLFLNENINNYVRELPVGRWFVDFAFVDLKIALEIDGKQHDYSDRKQKDQEKDKFLQENGWKVIRIKWKNPINENNKLFLFSQIKNIKDILSVKC